MDLSISYPNFQPSLRHTLRLSCFSSAFPPAFPLLFPVLLFPACFSPLLFPRRLPYVSREAYFPGALDDGMTVYKAALKTTDPRNIAVFGTSAGGALTLQMMLRAKQEGLPVPGAIAPGTPMSDATKTGDSFYTNEMIDNVLVSPDGFCHAATVVYAHGHDLADPLISPVYGDMHGFPPAILTTGTRDLLLSNTVRVHRKLRQAGVDAQLQVFEGQSHAHYLFNDQAPKRKKPSAKSAPSSTNTSARLPGRSDCGHDHSHDARPLPHDQVQGIRKMCDKRNSRTVRCCSSLRSFVDRRSCHFHRSFVDNRF